MNRTVFVVLSLQCIECAIVGNDHERVPRVGNDAIDCLIGAFHKPDAIAPLVIVGNLFGTGFDPALDLFGVKLVDMQIHR